MADATERRPIHLEESCSRPDHDHDHDIIHELSRRLDSIWRYDQYVADAEWRVGLKQFWIDMKAQEQANINRLKELIVEEVHNNCF